MKQTEIREIATRQIEEGKTQIEERIFTIRGKQVMLDRDLALLYGVETKALNQAVKRNIERFPDDFMFQLDYQECLRSQIVTLNTKRGQHLKYMPYAFTEQGVAMLSGVIKSAKAVEVNIKIMRAFVIMRNMVANDSALNRRMTELEFKQKQTDINVEKILKIINETDYIPRQGIFFDGQIYDAYTFVTELIRKATRRIVLIDNYIDDTVLTMLSKRAPEVEATIYTGKVSKQLQLDIDKHNAQYPPITVRTFSKAHDRFLIIDDAVYLVGASIKDLGKKWFGFTLMENTVADELIEKILVIILLIFQFVMDNFQTGGTMVPEPDKAKNQDFSEWITDLRGRKVILDYQLATLYGVETKNLKRAVKANMNRFPPDFMFELTADEFHALRCRNFTSNGRGRYFVDGLR